MVLFGKFERCEGPACRSRGAFRSDYRAVLCDTHAEIPSYAPKPIITMGEVVRFVPHMIALLVLVTIEMAKGGPQAL